MPASAPQDENGTSSTSSDRSSLPRRLLFVVPTAGAIVMIIYIVRALPLQSVAASAGQDATALIGTLVLVYTFFVAAYGALIPLITALPGGWRHDLALVLLLLAVELDLYRVINSMGDLYRTTMGNLSDNKIHDAAAEFGRYFVLNVVILILLFTGIFWTSQSGEITCSRLKHPA